MNTVINDIKAKLQAILEDIEKENYEENSEGIYDLANDIDSVNDLAVQEANRLEEEEMDGDDEIENDEEEEMSEEEIKEQIADDTEDDRD